MEGEVKGGDGKEEGDPDGNDRFGGWDDEWWGLK